METKVLNKNDLILAVKGLKRGESVVFPTETVYGLGAPIFNERAVAQIFSIKGRPQDNPLIAHISTLAQAETLASELSDLFFLLAEKFWPGPLTVVVKKRETVPSIVSAGHPTIAIRMPSHPIAKQLIEAVGEPLVAPSANLSGRPSPTCVKDVLEDLGGKVEWVIDGGDCEVGIESTVISLVDSTPVLLRPGSITQAMLEDVLGKNIAHPHEGGPIHSPGMKYRHYAPKARVHLIYKLEELTGPFIIPTAKNLYSQLREADRMGMASIEVYCDQETQSNAGLMNRLLKAAGQSG